MNDTDTGAGFNRRIQGFLAIAVTIGFFAVIGVLFASQTINSSVKDILLVMLGALLATWKEVTGYFFGSSSGSAKKDDQNAALTAQITATPVAPTPPIKVDDAVPIKVDQVNKETPR